MRALETTQHRGITIEIHHDQDCESPREYDNLGTIIGWHRNYRLSDKCAPTGIEPSDFDPTAYAVCLPVYMLDHSGIALSTADFCDRWDSGQVGWIYATRAKILDNFQRKHLTAAVRQQAIDVLKSEIAEYGRYVNGECYGYVIKDDDGDELDACWGFIGFEYVQDEAKRQADYYADKQIQRADALTDAQRSEN